MTMFLKDFPKPWAENAVQLAVEKDRKSKSALSGLIVYLYRIRRLRRLSLALCRRLEGEDIYSQSLRRIFRDVYGVTVGPYSYGGVLRPGVLPPGSVVGNYCSVGQRLIVRRRDHPIDEPILHPFLYNSELGFLTRDTLPKDRDNPLTIGHDVWIGDRVTILSGCKSIGNGAVIAAGAVVTRDIEPYSVVAGVPAKQIKLRLTAQQRQELEASKWWEQSLPELMTRVASSA